MREPEKTRRASCERQIFCSSSIEDSLEVGQLARSWSKSLRDETGLVYREPTNPPAPGTVCGAAVCRSRGSLRRLSVPSISLPYEVHDFRLRRAPTASVGLSACLASPRRAVYHSRVRARSASIELCVRSLLCSHNRRYAKLEEKVKAEALLAASS